MDAGFVGKGVAADDRFVGLHRLVGEPGQQLARLEEQRRLNRRVERQPIPAHAQRHHDLFERGVAGALADPVDRALDLANAAGNRGEAVGDRQTKVVVAVRAEHRFVGIRHPADDLGEKLPRFVGRAVADGVRQVDRGRAVVDGGLDDAAQEIAVASRRVLGRKLHVVGELPRAADAVNDRGQAGVAGDAQLALEVQVGGRQERVDAAPLGRSERAGGFLDVLRPASRQRGDHRTPDVAGDVRHGLGVGRRRNREARLDDVHSQRVEGARHLHLGRDLEREAGGLFAVAQGGVEDHDPRGISSHGTECARQGD